MIPGIPLKRIYLNALICAHVQAHSAEVAGAGLIGHMVYLRDFRHGLIISLTFGWTLKFQYLVRNGHYLVK